MNILSIALKTVAPFSTTRACYAFCDDSLRGKLETAYQNKDFCLAYNCGKGRSWKRAIGIQKENKR